ncbi:Histone H4-like protein [Mycena chlorophos]|uniref:Histone H4 n=1 Tax=Mycena chlorophos TaxID=658473 RepID=A0A8H6WH46_MYCCL|nr:Histone H4-like protein [Mycena chlorophos]
MARTKQTARRSTGGKSCCRRVFLTPAARRRAAILRDAVLGLSRPSLRRVARRGGVKRIRRTIYDDARASLRGFLVLVIRDAARYAGHGYRSTVTEMDVKYALMRSGMMLYT